MHIALVGPGIMSIPPVGHGAVEILIWNYYEELSKLGHRVDIINTPNRNEIINAVNRETYDFVHIHYDVFCDIIPMLKTKKIVITSHYPYIGDNAKYGGYLDIFNFICNNKKFYIFALCQKDKDAFIKGGADKDRIFVTQNGVSEKFLFLDVPSKKTICLGKIEPRKRPELIADFSDIDFYGPSIYQNFGTYCQTYKGEIKKDDLYKELTTYANLILISSDESDPLVVKEAMMAGLGVVLSEGASHQVDKNNTFVHVVPEKDIRNKTYIQKIINENIEKSTCQRKEIRKYAIQNYSWSCICKKYLEIVEELV